MFSLSVPSVCVWVICLGVLLVAGVGGKAAVPVELALPCGWGVDAGDSNHTWHCCHSEHSSYQTRGLNTSRDCVQAWHLLRSPGGL